jgi:hypothetical protein
MQNNTKKRKLKFISFFLEFAFSSFFSEQNYKAKYIKNIQKRIFLTIFLFNTMSDTENNYNNARALLPDPSKLLVHHREVVSHKLFSFG